MSSETDAAVLRSWDVLATHDWRGNQAIETSLSNALDQLATTSAPLYDYIDLEAVRDTLGPEASQRGASEVRFEYENFEIRITDDGTIAAREHRARPQSHL